MPRYYESLTQRKKRLEKEKLKRRERRERETYIEKQLRLERKRAWRFNRILNEPLEDRFFRQYIDRIQQQDRRKVETPEQREARIGKIKIRAHIRRTRTRVCSICNKWYYPHEVTEYNRTEQFPFVQQQNGKKLVLCYVCNEHSAELPGLGMPWRSSVADSDREESMDDDDSETEPLSLLEIKEESLWEERPCSPEDPVSGENPDQTTETKEQDPVAAALERMRGELGALARGADVSAGLERLQGEIRELARGDEFDAFGRYVASLLRGMRPRRAQQVQPLVINLLTAEMIKTEDDDR